MCKIRNISSDLDVEDTLFKYDNTSNILYCHKIFYRSKTNHFIIQISFYDSLNMIYRNHTI